MIEGAIPVAAWLRSPASSSIARAPSETRTRPSTTSSLSPCSRASTSKRVPSTVATPPDVRTRNGRAASLATAKKARPSSQTSRPWALTTTRIRVFGAMRTTVPSSSAAVASSPEPVWNSVSWMGPAVGPPARPTRTLRRSVAAIVPATRRRECRPGRSTARCEPSSACTGGGRRVVSISGCIASTRPSALRSRNRAS